ncbi:hypothetical protein KEM52_001561, partial [Ascosphaera acerosa]
MAATPDIEKTGANRDSSTLESISNTSQPALGEKARPVARDAASPEQDHDKPAPRPSSAIVRDDDARPPRRWTYWLNPLRWQKVPPVPLERGINREKRANLLSIITFQWISPLMTTGYLRTLELKDIWLVHPDRELDVLSERLRSHFDKLHSQGSRYPLLWALYQTFKRDFLLGGACQLLSSLLQVFSPYTTRYLISFATEAWLSQHVGTPEPHIGRGVGLVIGICLMQLTQSIAMNQFFYRGMVVGGQARAALIEAIFVKSTTISSRARAGGKALPGEDHGNATNPPANDDQQIKDARDTLQRRRGKGPKLPEDKQPGIVGDGAGWGNGRIVTLMSVDTDRIDKGFGLFHLAWTGPVIIIVTLVLLIVNIGYSCLPGYGLLLICIPLLTLTVKSLFSRRMAINKTTDQRVSLTQEILHAVRFVKYFSWESSFLDRLQTLRYGEVKQIQVLQAMRNALMCCAISLPIFASMLSFITYALSKHDLNPAHIFSSLALFNALRSPLNMLPLSITQLTDAYAALTRIQAFLLAEDQPNVVTDDPSLSNVIEVVDATFTWERAPTDEEGGGKGKKKAKRRHRQKTSETPASEKGSEGQPTDPEAPPFELEHVNLSLARNELVAVIGNVGSGKTSLLAALAGEMRLTDGTARMNASRAYCPQYAWIQNATVRENILFGKPFDQEKYDAVIEACALKPDLEMFAAGDQTEIGERGITLSGGQKQRLNIARAMYFSADLILLDDPLSAVDAHVGRHIMDKAICGLLANTCRLLATHQLHVLNRCDRIIMMDNGKIERIGTFQELMDDCEPFRRLMATTSQEVANEKETAVGKSP